MSRRHYNGSQANAIGFVPNFRRGKTADAGSWIGGRDASAVRGSRLKAKAEEPANVEVPFMKSVKVLPGWTLGPVFDKFDRHDGPSASPAH
jgi:hypothetical protein